MALGPISGDPRNLQVVATISLIQILARSILGTKRPALPFPASRGKGGGEGTQVQSTGEALASTC